MSGNAGRAASVVSVEGQDEDVLDLWSEARMYVARVLKKTQTHHRGVKFPVKWRDMTLEEKKAWRLGVDMALAKMKRMADD